MRMGHCIHDCGWLRPGVLKGRFTDCGEDGAKTGAMGEVIFLTNGTKVAYYAEEATEVVGSTYPHWR